MMTQLPENVQAVLVQPQSEQDIIVLRYDMEEVDLDLALKIHNSMVELFPNNKIVSLPDYASLTAISKEELKEIIDSLQGYYNKEFGQEQ